MPIDHFPPHIKPLAYRLRSWLLTDGGFLLLMGIEIIIRGQSYFGVRPGGHPVEGYLRMDVWAWIWISVGVLCFIGAVRPHSSVAKAGLGLWVGLHIIWGLSFLADWIIGGGRGYVTATGYLFSSLFAVLAVWRGSRSQIDRGPR